MFCPLGALPLPAAGISAEDRAEFELLKGKITDLTADAYLKHRRDFFGNDDAYRAFAADSDIELDQTKGLRRLIEFSKKGQEGAQTVFYRWVRKAYLKDGVDDVPAQIRRGGSPELRDALAKVKAKYGQAFKSGGFNPRPKKDASYRYRLGTISEHGLGTAIDIEDARNPILSKTEWKFIEKLAGKTVDRSAATWRKAPSTVWTGIKDLNDEFVKNVAAEVKRVREEQSKAALPPGKTHPDPLHAVLAGQKNLEKWTGGFFSLEWELVEALHDNDFLWGATFPNAVDLHHFELSD